MDEDKKDPITSGILGLGGAPVPKEPTDPTTEHDPESVAHRRARMREELDDVAQPEDTSRQHSGATGIDMGAGGEGTDLSGE
jgi:hypothetical protein